MLSPQVSVVVPAYNVANYLKDALVSLENQSFQDFEVLVVDDGSTDKTADIVKSFTSRDRRFHLLQKPNGGLSSARNYGIRHARGEYIALLDGDDLYSQDKLATHIAILATSPQVGLVYSASRTIRDDGRPMFISLSGKPIQSDPLISLLCKNFIGHGSNAVFRRCIFDEIGGFDESLRSCEDIDYWLRIAATKRWKFHLVPSIQCFYRVRPSGLSFNVEEMENTQTRVINAACQRNSELIKSTLPTARAYMYRYLARVALTCGDKVAAREYINRALDSDGSIFWRDPRSLLTLFSVRLAPLSQLVIKRSLKQVKSKTN